MQGTLAERDLHGWPDCRLTLEVYGKEYIVTLFVRSDVQVIYKGASKLMASNAFLHPFAFGIREPDLTGVV